MKVTVKKEWDRDSGTVAVYLGGGIAAEVSWYLTLMVGDRWHYHVVARAGNWSDSWHERGFGYHVKTDAASRAKEVFARVMSNVESRLKTRIAWKRVRKES